MSEGGTALGLVEAHYLLCPYCGGRAALDSHCCSRCGALAESVNWRPPPGESWSPELALVSRRAAR